MLTELYQTELSERSQDVLHKVITHPSIQRRYISVDTTRGLRRLKNEDPDERIERFCHWAVTLAQQAAEGALAAAAVSSWQVRALVVNTCTGYLCPGIATYLVERLGLRPEVQAYDLVGSGCGGAVPNLQQGAALLQTFEEGVVLCVAVEICSATFQMDNDISLILSNALFGDGAAAAVLTTAGSGPQLRPSESLFVPALRDTVRYVHRQGQLFNRLSPTLPRLVGETGTPRIKRLLERQGLQPGHIAHWAIHPGGAKMLDELQQRLGLSDHQMAVSREVLRDHGNMSSPTVLFALRELMLRGIDKGEWCVMTAFGAGFSAHSCLLQG
jgi:predicted naringenin-chalcone synthase